MSPGAGPHAAARFGSKRSRTRQRGAAVGALLAALVAAACGEGEAPEPGPTAPPSAVRPGVARPAAANVLLIAIDTLRADHTSLAGDRPTTPRLAQLSSESLSFRRAYSQAPWTTPSVGSLLTSRSPTALGIHGERSPLPAEARLLSEVLHEAGFATGAVVSHDFCSSRWGFAQGFGWFDESSIRGYQAISSPRVTNLGISFVEAQRDRPWFLFLHYFDPHFSYIEHPRFAFGGGDDAYAGPIRTRMLFRELYAQRGALDSADLAELERLYDSEIAFTDHHIGRLLDHLRDRDLLDRTLVILTADHGEEFLDHGDLGHAKTLYDELVRVPLIIRVPNAEPAVVEQPVGLIDVYPSVLDFLGLPPEPDAEGRSLFRGSGPDSPPARPVYTETSRAGRSLRGIVEGEHKLVLDLESGRSKLFALRDDPSERRDLAAREPHRTRALRAKLEAWIESQQGLAGNRAELELTAEERDRLRALGYLEVEAER